MRNTLLSHLKRHLRTVGLLAAVIAAAAAGTWASGVGDEPPARDAVSAPPAPAAALPPPPAVRVRPQAEGVPEKAAGPAFEYEYRAPAAPELQVIYERVRDADLWRQLPEVQALDGMFELARPLRYATEECAEFGAFYRPAQTEIVLCYETLRTLYERGKALAGPDASDEFPLRYTLSNARFIVLHETGHALVDLLDLPVTGRQEDAVDQLAAILMLRFAGVRESPAETAEALRLAAHGMLREGTGAYNLRAYADEHALAEQRYFNLQCWVYGIDPEAYAALITDGDLTAERARGCPREIRAIDRAWRRLLQPHLAPKFELTGLPEETAAL